MKNLYLFLVALFSITGNLSAQCVVDPNAQTVPGVNPTADQLPCIERGLNYNQTLQGKIQQSDDISIIIINIHVEVDSVRIDSIAGIPNGITWSKSPDVLLGGGNGCINFSGITNDPAGSYNLTAFGTAWLTVTSPTTFPRAFTGNLNRFSPFGNYALTVINPGDPCVPALGVKDFNAELNSALTVFPNPNAGVFELNLNTGRRIKGDIAIMDITGRTVFTQNLDVVGLYKTTINLSNFSKGLYSLQLRTAEGFASKNISIE